MILPIYSPSKPRLNSVTEPNVKDVSDKNVNPCGTVLEKNSLTRMDQNISKEDSKVVITPITVIRCKGI